jgi:hypothetical protein
VIEHPLVKNFGKAKMQYFAFPSPKYKNLDKSLHFDFSQKAETFSIHIDH